uniref:Uncharacterized protein n=1 Tax=Oryza barthii TaxID=65489 RepID=A0A0D3G0D4_9ORYZ
MGIEPINQRSSEEPPSLPSTATAAAATAVDLLHSASTKPQPCPTDPNDADQSTQRWILPESWVDSSSSSSEEDDSYSYSEEEEEEEEIEATPQNGGTHWSASDAEFRATARERLIPAVILAESRKKLGHHPPAPPFEIINHPGRSSSSFVRQSFRESMGMGYHTAVQCVACTFSRYKEYLVDYYNRNQKKPNAAADLTGDDDSLTALANKCAEMEGHLMFLFKFRAGVFAENVEIKINRTSDKITKRARETTNALESEFPAAAVAFKGITREANLTCELVKERHKDKNGREFFSIFIRTRTLASMGNTAGKLISDDSDVKTCSGKDVVENDILDDWIVISPKKAETIG